MSEVFDGFLMQYGATGREWGDGFCPAHFNGMTEGEKIIAKEMLAKLAIKGDSIAIEGLGYLATTEAVEELLRLLANNENRLDVHLTVVSSLWNATKDLTYQDELIGFFSSPDPKIRMRAANELRYTPPSQKLLESYCGILSTELDEKTRQAAALGVMYCIGLLKDPMDIGAKYIGIFRGLSDADDSIRTATLAEAKQVAQSMAGA